MCGKPVVGSIKNRILTADTIAEAMNVPRSFIPRIRQLNSRIMAMSYVLPPKVHNDLVDAAFRKRGFTADESAAAARFCELAARHGIKTHNAIKALHLDEHFGSKAGGCAPGAKIEKL